MIRVIFSLFLFLVSVGIWACDCSWWHLDNAYRNSSFVVSGKISSIKNYENDPTLFKVSIEVYEEFKGKNLKEFFVNNPDKVGGMCHPYLKVGEELLVYLYPIENGLPFLGYCSRYFPLDYVKTQSPELEILTILKNSKINYTSSFRVEEILFESRKENDFFSRLSGLKSNPSIPPYGIFEIEYHHLFGRSTARIIRGFGNNLDPTLIKWLENTSWELYDYSQELKLSSPTKFILVLENDFSALTDSFDFSRYTFR
ncbi:hypothetical protein Aoki45_37780 [Algoriphagus sp. oki45]|uniref:hypothetical protein n=1 Tax=Algoriphagus sp. oki45 TaxID=3067294 RepID=UPI0027EBFCD3|nr:hypothetical protein Aoki45_37780 [Algoriphagus sp. oki45]